MSRMGEAMARMGETIAQVGEKGLEIAERARKFDEAGKTAEFLRQRNEEASQFSNELLTRHDTENWTSDFQEKVGKWNEGLKGLNLSPDGMARANEQMADWTSKTKIHLETQAAVKTVERGSAQVRGLVESSLSTGDFDGAVKAVDFGASSGIYSPEMANAAKAKIAERQAEHHLGEDIKSDPRSALDRLNSPSFINDTPGATLDMRDRGIAQAKAQLRDNMLGTQDRILNGIADGTLDTPAKIAAQGGDLGAADVAELQYKLSLRNDAVEKQRLSRPDVQAGLIGEISATLRTLAPDDTDGQVALQRQISDLPPGEIKNKLSGEFGARIKGESVEAKSYAEFVMGQLDASYDAGRFGKPGKPDNIATADLVRDGFLKDTGKIQRLGFSEGQAEDIADAAKKDPAAGQKKFIDLWKDRDLGSVKASEIEIATAKALKEGNATVGWDSPASVAERLVTAQRYGLAKMKMTEYLKLNPQAKKEEIDKQFLKITGAGVMEDAKRKLVPDRPGRIEPSTSMVLPKGGLKLSNYGYPSDTTPDSNSAKGTGHRNNKLIAGESAAVSKSLADRLNLKHGDKLKIETTKGDFTVFYHDTVPATDKRTGDLPETIDIYRPKDGSNGWGGRVTKVSKI